MSQRKIKKGVKGHACHCPRCQGGEIGELMERLHAPYLDVCDVMKILKTNDFAEAFAFVFQYCRRHNPDAVRNGSETIGQSPFFFATTLPDGSAAVSLHSMPKDVLEGPAMIN